MNLKTIALTTTALVAIASAPAYAGQYMGKVNLGVGFAWEDFDTGGEGYDANYSVLHGGASVNVPYSDRVNLQFDVFGSKSMDDAGGEGTEGSFYGGFGAGMHINYKDPSEGAIGVFASVGRANVGGVSFYTDGVVYAAGLEGEYYCNAWTLMAQVGYLDTDPEIYGLVKNAGFVRAGAAYYASNKLKLSGNVGYLNGGTWNSGDVSDVEQWNWAFTLEYMFGKSVPVSTYVEYKGSDTEYYTSPAWTDERHEVRAGVRFYFGAGDSLQKADREGASFEAPDILTWSRFNPD
jgi:hypothetical protein